jgi:chromate transporter
MTLLDLSLPKDEKTNPNRQSNLPSTWAIFRDFLHLGLTAYGGLAMVEPIRRRVVRENGWLTQKEFMDGLALCQIVPGATVVQLATYVGYRLQKTLGAVLAAIAFILPAFFLMLGLSFLYFQYGQLSWVKSVSRGLNAVVIALLVQALWRLEENVRQHWLDFGIALVTFGSLWLGMNYLLVFLGAGALRLILGLRFSPQAGSHAEVLSDSSPEPGIILIQIMAALVALGLMVWGLGRLNHDLGLMSLIFLKIGVISFGGGYAMIPILQWDMVDHLGWLTLQQFLDGILLGFVTPGPIIILATFVGYWVHGLLGAVVATVSIFLPPIAIIIFLTPFYQRIKEARLMRHVIRGILAALVGMLVLVIIQMGQAALTDIKAWAVMVGASLALIAFKVNLLWVVAATIIFSVVTF